MFVSLLRKRVDILSMNAMDVNPEFTDDILLQTLLTTFTVLRYGLYYNREGVYKAYIKVGSKVQYL